MIKNKEYVPVVERVKEFHRKYPSGSITTDICYDYASPDVKGNIRATVKATVKIDDNQSFTGHSQAEWSKSQMGMVALEVAETSAIGRALGFAGIGLLDGVASADEMHKADGKTTKGAISVSDAMDDEPPF